MQKVYLLCGVPGSGKTWVATQVQDKFTYIPHDDFLPDRLVHEAAKAARGEKPVLVDCPFAERVLREGLLEAGLRIVPVFIVENPLVIRARYEEREQREIPKQHLTRATSIGARAAEWQAFRGTSRQVLDHLKEVENG